LAGHPLAARLKNIEGVIKGDALTDSGPRANGTIVTRHRR
jgi:hypothetical protein